AGAFSFVVGAALEEAPDQVVSGPTVTFQVPDPKKRRFPWWIVILAAVAALLLAGGGILIYSLTRPEGRDPAPSPSATAASTTRPVFNRDDFLVDESSMQEDLDMDGIVDVSLSDTDLSPATTVRSPTIVSGTTRGVGLVADPTFEACREVVLGSGSIAIAESDDDAIVCVFTSGGHAAILEFEASLPDETREVRFTVWE
ncbi:hypothetical protein ACLQ2Q_21105, partial [Microbacterium sp. DT81.1]|uniref:hypothetical protein n=1 Tax=Microbacterium sp. DT81.1 TaxID=3393413 RepID=UPI003CE67E2C